MDLNLIVLAAILVLALLLVLLIFRQRSVGGLSDAEIRQLAQSVLDQHASRLSEAAASERERLRSEDAARQNELNLILKPLKENLEKVETKLSSLESQRADLMRQLDTYKDLGKELNERTTQLGNALRRPEVRGRWGEMQLKRLVEMAGMAENVDFIEQLSVDTDEKQLRPDMVINMTQGGQIAVDSKVPLDAYLLAVTLQGDEREDAMKKVATQIKSHIEKLAKKEYWHALNNSASFTVMFIPIEGAFQEAVGVEPDLVEFAANHRVAIATPFTLLGMLHTIARLETQFQIAQKIDAYLHEARKLHQRASKFSEYLGKAQKSLNTATRHLDTAARTFDRGFMKSIDAMNSTAIASGVTEAEADEILELMQSDEED